MLALVYVATKDGEPVGVCVTPGSALLCLLRCVFADRDADSARYAVETWLPEGQRASVARYDFAASFRRSGAAALDRYERLVRQGWVPDGFGDAVVESDSC